MNNELKKILKKKLQGYGYEEFLEPLWEYVSLLEQWNKTYNLTAIRDKKQMIDKHLIDSLAVCQWLKGFRILDVGTGPGLPGIPLAVTHPKLQFVLLDSNGKKIRFLREIKRRLGLSNIELQESRVENYHPAQGFDTVISRAFSSLKQMTDLTAHLLNNKGIWLAMKGRYPEEELNRLNYPYTVHPYAVEGIEGERCCVLIKNKI